MVEFSLWDILRNLLLAARWTVSLSLIAFIGGGLVGLLLLVLRLSKVRGVDRAVGAYGSKAAAGFWKSVGISQHQKRPNWLISDSNLRLMPKWHPIGERKLILRNLSRQENCSKKRELPFMPSNQMLLVSIIRIWKWRMA